ncbi:MULTISPECIES: TraR/DksA family transcriptional regulator [Roseobacteraceae]|jgi:RNA polymerase-binding transcription factor DksA|uniref:TraR/DksA family transcriptional regulator n=1 Tax=Roseobacteraceae TaxID=2854170 RepID=UPI0019389213|nr:TraR/DksA C4-type zinc finger protein [Roseovarius sp. 10]MBE1290787.1 TraR/DksA family transcriptional regulator [Paracoccaceae bacterium]MBF9055991.1 TraR/DksA family transcriptional regulator [Rhodobacterales bacterium HKCCA1065]MDV7200518.1 TraR/DksA C4-type zinc finger protein [Roseovarius sp. 10]QPI85563.1 TraR/DksA family transcriptional regulator [Rhodobacterales bacterium HKCCA1288]
MSGHLSKTAIAAKRDQLQTRLAQLDQRIHTVEDALDAPHSRDWPEAAKEREDDEALEALGLEAQHEIAMINAAIARIDAGQYGICTSCDLPIAEDRLEVLPFTPFCRDCAAQAAH